MKNILWVKLPQECFEDRRKYEDFFKNEIVDDEKDLRIIITYGDCKLTLLGRPIFVYPYWLLKLKLWLQK